MKWGTGDSAARDRINTLTAEELREAGVTRKMAKHWADFYWLEARKNPNNPSAAGRAELMRAAAELLK